MKREEILLTLEKILDDITEKLRERSGDGRLIEMFRKCFMNTAETTLKVKDGEIFLITGDIEAMWLRDSCAQVIHYMPFAKDYPVIGEMIKGLVLREFRYICLDPYANAFNEFPKVSKWRSDFTEMNDLEWERKYEVDSLCYPVKLLADYYEKTGDRSVFTDTVHEGLKKVVDTFITEQNHYFKSKYRFVRIREGKETVLKNDGLGTPVWFTGMTWSGFRPSDDACTYGYLIPSNLFATVILKKIACFAEYIYRDLPLTGKALKLAADIKEGIEKFGVISDKEFGEIYAYEADGFGNTLFMDDANVPSLLSLPCLNVCDKDDLRYLRTRKAVLSKKNPYYFIGKAASGIGSPHTPLGMIWPISLCMQGLTTDDIEEKKALIKILTETDAGTGFMHESFDCDNPDKFTRKWFAWANSLFSLFVMDCYGL